MLVIFLLGLVESKTVFIRIINHIFLSLKYFNAHTMERTILLGIDPSFYTMGCALYDEKKRTLKLFTGTYQECLKWLGQNCKLATVAAIVENPALDSAVFGAWAEMKKAIVNYKSNRQSIGELASIHAIGLKKAQYIGENKAAAKMIIASLRRKGVPVLEVAPSQRQKAYKEIKEGKNVVKKLLDVRFLNHPTKCNKKQFSDYSGFVMKGTEHAYDAGTLITKTSVTKTMYLIRLEEAKEAAKPSSYPNRKNGNQFLVKRKAKTS